MMWDLFEVLAKRYPEKVQELTSLTSVKKAEQVSEAGTGNAKPTYFRVYKSFLVDGVDYYVGTSYSKDAKLAQMKKMIAICNAPNDIFEIEGDEYQKKVTTMKKKSYDI